MQIWQVISFRTSHVQHQELYKRSIFNLVPVYNALPQHVVNHATVTEFQAALTRAARFMCHTNHEDWQQFLSARHHKVEFLQHWHDIFTNE